MELKLKVYIGTSGWSYAHWKENFYPHGLNTTKWLDHYSQTFPTVEVNTTFYHLPLETTINKWNAQVPSNFVFSIKASRYITHRKRLHDCKDSVKLFFDRIKKLKPKLGPILFQLPPSFKMDMESPPSFKMDMERLSKFVKWLHDDYRYVFEFRHPTWYVDEIYGFLRENNIALCITDLNGEQSPEVITSDFTYLRFHGPHKAYKGSYGITKLTALRKKIDHWKTDISVYCYFDNDEKGYAIQDAKVLLDFFNG